MYPYVMAAFLHRFNEARAVGPGKTDDARSHAPSSLSGFNEARAVGPGKTWA